MPKTIVKCSTPKCQKNAEYKVAAPWKYGSFSELKTYGHACADHLESYLDYARRRRRGYHLPPDETVGEISAFTYEEGKRDSELKPV